MVFCIACEFFLVDILRYAGVRAPCRISSLPVGAPLRPGIYAYIEDICAVDGSGGTEFRQRLNLRYQASKSFREMLHRLTLFWAAGAFGCTVVTCAIIWTVQRDAAYVVSQPISPPDLNRDTNVHRSAGPSPSSGPASGPPSRSPGCSAASSTNTRNGRLRNGKLDSRIPNISRPYKQMPIAWRRRFLKGLHLFLLQVQRGNMLDTTASARRSSFH